MARLERPNARLAAGGLPPPPLVFGPSVPIVADSAEDNTWLWLVGGYLVLKHMEKHKH